MNVQDLEEYTMVPNVQFLEFIPIEDMEEQQPKTLFMEQVKIITLTHTYTQTHALSSLSMCDYYKAHAVYKRGILNDPERGET